MFIIKKRTYNENQLNYGRDSHKIISKIVFQLYFQLEFLLVKYKMFSLLKI